MGGKEKYRHTARPGKGFDFFNTHTEDSLTPTSPKVQSAEVTAVPEYESLLTSTPWVEPFALDIAKKAADELIFGDRLKKHIEGNQQTPIYPKAGTPRGAGSVGWWNKDFRNRKRISVSTYPDVAPSVVYNNDVSQEGIKQHDVAFTFPALGIAFSGKFTRERIQQEVIPVAIKALVEAGLSKENAEKKVVSSLGRILNEKTNIVRTIESVHRVLSNLDYEIKTGAVIPQYRARMQEESDAWVEQPQSNDELEYGVRHKVQNNQQVPKVVSASEEVVTGDSSENNSNNAGRTEWQEEYQDWQDKDFVEPVSAPASVDDVAPIKNTPVEVSAITSATDAYPQESTTNQLDRLIEKTRNLRETAGLSHTEALAELPHFNDVRTSIRNIRNEIKQLEKKGDTEEKREEIQRLRNTLAASLRAFRTLNRSDSTEKPGESVDTKVDTQNGETLKALTETFEATIQSFSIHADGVTWYQEHISKDISFSKIFDYLQHNFSDADTAFRDKIYAVVKTQISFQHEAAEITSILKKPIFNEKEVEEKIESLQNIGRQVVKMQKRFNKASIYEQQEAVKVFENFGVTSKDYVPPSEPDIEPALSTAAERLLVRNVWKEKKEKYEDEYAKYLETEKEKRNNGSVFSKVAFWRKESKSEALTHAEHEYQEARRTYAGLLNTALFDRFNANEAGMKAGLANRFIIGAAQEKREIEKSHLNEKQSKLFTDLKHILSEHRATIRKIGFISTLATGSLFGVARYGVSALKNYITSDPAHAESILAQYTLGGIKAFSAFSAVTLGVGAGTYAGLKLGEYNVSNKEKRKDSVRQKARTSFSAEKIDQFEKEYLARAKELEQAINAKKKIVVAGAVAGGVLGGVISGGIDVDHIHERIVETFTKVPDIQPSSTLDSLSQQGPLDVDHKQILNQILPDTVSPKVDLEVPQGHAEKIVHDQILPTDEPLSPKGSLEPGTIDGTIPSNKIPPLLDDLPDGRLPDEQSASESTPDYGDNMGDERGADTNVSEGNGEVETDESEDPSDALNVVPEYSIPYTFEDTSEVDSVSKALLNAWEEHKEFIDGKLTEEGFIDMFKTATDDLRESSPADYNELLTKMGITSGDIDDVVVGQHIDLAPMFAYLNEYNTQE